MVSQITKMTMKQETKCEYEKTLRNDVYKTKCSSYLNLS